jgi:hypothetical protein
MPGSCDLYLYYLFHLIKNIHDEHFPALNGILFAAEMKVMREGLHVGPMGRIIPSSHHLSPFLTWNE